jgi:DnaJ-domain-containing protein 1
VSTSNGTQCEGLTLGGARCRARALSGSAFCNAHDPDRQRRRAEREAEWRRRQAAYWGKRFETVEQLVGRLTASLAMSEAERERFFKAEGEGWAEEVRQAKRRVEGLLTKLEGATDQYRAWLRPGGWFEQFVLDMQRFSARQEEARSVLGLGEQYTPEDLERAYRRLAMRHHPDRGGEAAAFSRVQAAYDCLRRR